MDCINGTDINGYILQVPKENDANEMKTKHKLLTSTLAAHRNETVTIQKKKKA